MARRPADESREMAPRLFVLIWLVVAISGFCIVAKYAYTPGPAAEPPAQWPSGTGIPLTPGHAALVMLAHPECPCTRASLEELARVLTVYGKKLDAHVVFLQAEESAGDGYSGGLPATAAAIPGLHVWIDRGGRMIERFGAYVSGQVLVYDPSGRLAFSGGITAGRGHAGDNPGVEGLMQLGQRGFRAPVNGEPLRSAVFGCTVRVHHV